ncbi:MAG: LLM class flavin-dependent oxidoreductase [Myxococcaceae bacterium]|nr:LLM class flavin-dependent oxidoreductase [Myxococcaceae bacterium]
MLHTLVDLLCLRAEKQGDALLYHYLENGEVDGPSEQWSYQRLDAHARSLGTLLQEQGAAGERALLLYPPGMEFISAFMGCLYAGAVAVPTYPPDPTRLDRTLPRLRAIAQDSGARWVLTTSAIRDMAEFMLPQAPELGQLRWVATDSPSEEQARAWRRPEVSGDSLAFLQYTSGSTGSPKGVMVSHANILHNQELIRHGFGHEPGSGSGVGWLPLFHDMGLIGNVLQPLYMGFPIVLMSPLAFLQRPLRWLEAISHFRASTSGGPNFAYDLCVRKATEADKARLDLSCWRLAFNGAEPVRRDTLERFAQAFAPCGFRRQSFYPCYGLAEATLIVTGGTRGQSFLSRFVQSAALEQGRAVPAEAAGPQARELVSSGRCASDQRLLIVHPESREPLGPEQVGEIWVAGPSVARGYWNRPEETAQALGARTAQGEGPFLRTGDLGLLSPEGELFVTGRLKDLLILRGRNLYPQDIELTVERAHRGVRPGCTAAFPVEVEGEERLAVAAEVDVREGLDTSVVVEAIRRAVAEEHSVHAHAVVLLQPRSIPKTSSGKIQRRATRAGFLTGELEVVQSSVAGAEPSSSEAPLPPLREALVTAPEAERLALLERFIRAELARVLGTAPQAIARDTELASLGLDSMGVLELQGRLESELGFPLPGAFLWEHPTLQSASTHLLQAWQGQRPEQALAAPPLAPAPEGSEPVLSSGQQRLWFLDRLVPGSALYNVHFRLRLSGPLDSAALERSLEALLRRHAVLRTVLPEVEGQPHVLMQPPAPVALPRVDLRPLAATEQKAELHRLGLAQAQQPFDLARGPLVRMSLVQLGEQEHVLLMTQHHAITDGWSIGVLAHELAALYRAACQGSAPSLPPPRLQYSDYARWQRGLGPLLDGQRAWWAERLAGLPRLELPTDKPRPREPSFQGALHSFLLPRELVQRLEALGRSEGCTLYVVLATAWATLLHRYAGQEDFALGTIVASRERSELRQVVGFFANTLVLRCNLAGAPSFRELLARMRRTFHEALAHADLPFEEVVGAARVARGGDNPLFQASFLLESLPPLQMQVPGMSWRHELPTPDGAVEGTAKFDVQLALAPSPEGLTGALEYRTDLFEPATMARLASHLEVLLRGAVEEPHQPISRLPLLTQAERHQVLVEWNDFSEEVPPPTSIAEQFSAQAARTPQAVAAVFEEQSLTYEQLQQRSLQLASHLRGLGVGPEVVVGLCVERSLDMVVGMLGILQAGGAYLPLDPDYPRERLAFMLEDSRAPVLVTQRHLAGSLSAQGVHAVLVDEPQSFSPAGPPRPSALPHHLAYVIYTSGSTGRPKGVMVPHATVANFFAAMDKSLGGPRPGAWLALTSISFDISVLELLWTLTRGFKVVIQGEQLARPQVPRRRSSSRPLEFSLFYFADDSEQSGGDKYRLLLEGARFADEHGFAAVWTPERHFHAFGGLYPNPSVTGAAIAAVTKRVGIRAGSVVLPLHHPVRVAEEWALVDNLSRGRVGLSFASGWHADDFVIAPHNYERRRELLLEGIETVRRLWRGEKLRLPNGAGQPAEVQVRPRPVQPELPFWLTAAGNPETFKAAGRLGANVLTHLLGQTQEDLRRNLALYREAWQQAGHPGEGHVTLMLHTYVHADASLVRARVEGPFRNYLKSSLDLMRGLGRTLGIDIDSASFSAEDMDRLVTHAFDRYFETSGLFGTPRELRERLLELRELGADEVGCLIDFGIASDLVLESLPSLDELRRLCERDSHRTGSSRSVPEQIHGQGITHMQCTPSFARALMMDAQAPGALGQLSRLLVGGEALPGTLAESLRQVVGGEVLNMYGPTETTIWSSLHRVASEQTAAVVPIGRPLVRTQLYVLDGLLQPAPVGVPGELYIGGEGVVRGYLGRPELTAERFVKDPFSPQPGARMYRTGDRARWLADGTVEFLGRVDYQLKVRGFRIEAGEIESALESLPAVRQAVVVAREEEPGDVRLVAYVVPAAEPGPDPVSLRAHLQQRLPEYMVPSAYVELKALPLTPNGKVDRKALPAPSAARSTRATFVAPQSSLEQQIAEVWQAALKVEQVGVDDNFFDLGGHSLLMVQVHARLREKLGRDIPLLKLLEHPTVGALARYLSRQESEPQASLEAAQDRARRQLESLRRQRQRARGRS